LLAGRDGTLWIGTDKGLVGLKEGKITHYEELAGVFIFTILEDRDGVVWAGGFAIPNGRLCAIQNGHAHCSGEDGILGPGILSVYEDSKGNLWVGVSNGLWRWKPGPAKFYPMPGELDNIHAFAEDGDGAVLITTHIGISRFIDGNIEPYPLPASTQLRVTRMLRDRDGGLWLATRDDGVIHVHHGRMDAFSSSKGLSDDHIRVLFEDHEGNIWVVTANGLDRFREFAVATLSTEQGLSNAEVWSVLADKDGSIWLGSRSGLKRWNDGQVKNVDTNLKQDGKLKGVFPQSIFQDHRGQIWFSSLQGFGYLKKDRFIPITGIPTEPVHGIAEDNTGNLWIAEQNSGLFRLSPRGEVQQIPWAGLGHKDHAYALAADASHGGLWLGFFRGGIAYFNDGAIRASYGPAAGLGEGIVHGFRFAEDGTLWVSTAGGLSRFKNGRFATLTSRNGLPCDTVHWMIEDTDRAIWLHMGCGLVRVARSDMDAWAAAVDNIKDADQTIRTIVRAIVFDSSDGITTSAYPGGYRPLVATSSDGKLWSAGTSGINVIDPRHIPFNKFPPPVHIEQITADHKPYDLTANANGSVRLPPRIRDLQIDYSALSFVAPEKVLFRYKLEGWDRDWQDAGTRRQAFYNNLPPRNYTFRVMACNNSGLWNEAGASLDFSVTPAYYQTIWFRSLCVIAFLGLVAALYEMRLRQFARQFNMRLEERVNERTRIARDLHDTLLQSFQGVLLKFHAVTYLLPDQPAEAQKSLETTIEQARQAITEGRDTVHGLRSSTLPANDLARALSLLAEELAANQTDGKRAEFRVQVEGTPRDLAPIVRDEVYRLGCEALRNAFRHAHAGRVELEIRYDRRLFRLRVRDDGKGIDPKVLGGDGRPGHYGLPGMHERARLVGGKLAVWSEIDSGTEAELTIPAAVAYAKSTSPRRPIFFRRGA